jgi:hypothetical protein
MLEFVYLNQNNFTLIIVALITGILSPITLQLTQVFLRNKKDSAKHSLCRGNEINNDEAINAKLSKLLEKYGFDRIWVAEFHNGGRTYSGKSFQRFSVTYESAARGISTESVSTQGIPTSIFSSLFKTLIEEGVYIIKNINKEYEKEHSTILSQIREFLRQRGVSGAIFISIKDISGNFVGFICASGVVKDIPADKNTIQDMKIYASSLAGYLESGGK